ncbi:ATP-binding protein, partial [Dehalococcoidia bacterium]|nr:ATP-binding protein [Dehalococcoidia bacterium]
MTKAIGKVVDKAGIGEFSFVATQYFQGDFVELEIVYSGGKKATIVGEIIHKEATNPYFEKPSAINYLSEKDESITSWNLYIVKVKPIAVIDGEGTKKLDFPPSPGTNVYSAEESTISHVLGLENQGIPIGHLKQQGSLRIHLSEDLLCRTHFSILGRTGSGKSYFAKGLAKCIKDRRLIIFSPTEEYNEIAKDINAQVFSKQDLLLPLNTSYIASIYELTLQEEILFREFMEKEMSSMEKTSFSNQEIAHKFRDMIQSKGSQKEQPALFDRGEFATPSSSRKDGFSKSIGSILSKIGSKSLFFSKQPMKVPFSKSTIIDMSELDLESQQVIMMYVLSKLLESYRAQKSRGTYPKLIVMI